jgi:hypothetical protein
MSAANGCDGLAGEVPWAAGDDDVLESLSFILLSSDLTIGRLGQLQESGVASR